MELSALALPTPEENKAPGKVKLTEGTDRQLLTLALSALSAIANEEEEEEEEEMAKAGVEEEAD